MYTLYAYLFKKSSGFCKKIHLWQKRYIYTKHFSIFVQNVAFSRYFKHAEAFLRKKARFFAALICINVLHIQHNLMYIYAFLCFCVFFLRGN